VVKSLCGKRGERFLDILSILAFRKDCGLVLQETGTDSRTQERRLYVEGDITDHCIYQQGCTRAKGHVEVHRTNCCHAEECSRHEDPVQLLKETAILVHKIFY
jgi:hypothetical protein